MKLKKVGYIVALFIVSFQPGYGQNNNCEPCQEALQYKQQFDNWFTGIYNSWNSSMYTNRPSEQSVRIVDNHALWIDYVEYDPKKMNDHARINYLKCPWRNPANYLIHNTVITQRNPVGYRGDKRSPAEIIAAGGYFPNKDGILGGIDDMTGHIDNSHSGSFVSTSSQFSISLFYAADMTVHHPPGTITGWVAEFRYSCHSLNIGGVESLAEILTSHIPLDHIICWIPIRSGRHLTGLNTYLLPSQDPSFQHNIDYLSIYWNPYYKGDKYWNPQGIPDDELFNDPMPVQLIQGRSPVEGNDLVHQLRCTKSAEIVPFGIFQKKHSLVLPVAGKPMKDQYFIADGRSNIVFEDTLYTAISISYMLLSSPILIKSDAVVFINVCNLSSTSNSGINLQPGAKLVIYLNDPGGHLNVNGVKVYPGSKGFVDVGG